jgi:hypothetical protein
MLVTLQDKDPELHQSSGSSVLRALPQDHPPKPTVISDATFLRRKLQSIATIPGHARLFLTRRRTSARRQSNGRLLGGLFHLDDWPADACRRDYRLTQAPPSAVRHYHLSRPIGPTAKRINGLARRMSCAPAEAEIRAVMKPRAARSNRCCHIFRERDTLGALNPSAREGKSRAP